MPLPSFFLVLSVESCRGIENIFWEFKTKYYVNRPVFKVEYIPKRFGQNFPAPSFSGFAHLLPTIISFRMRIGCLQFAPEVGDIDNNLNVLIRF